MRERPNVPSTHAEQGVKCPIIDLSLHTQLGIIAFFLNANRRVNVVAQSQRTSCDLLVKGARSLCYGRMRNSDKMNLAFGYASFVADLDLSNNMNIRTKRPRRIFTLFRFPMRTWSDTVFSLHVPICELLSH